MLTLPLCLIKCCCSSLCTASGVGQVCACPQKVRWAGFGRESLQPINKVSLGSIALVSMATLEGFDYGQVKQRLTCELLLLEILMLV